MQDVFHRSCVSSDLQHPQAKQPRRPALRRSSCQTPFRVVRPPMCVGKNYQEHVKEVDSWKGPGITQPSAPTVSEVFAHCDDLSLFFIV